jgi:putative flippase GtrA
MRMAHEAHGPGRPTPAVIWVSRSLAVGAVATAVDVTVLLLAVRWLHLSNPVGAMLGVAVGSTVAFLGNRRFAFQDSDGPWLPEALRFLAGTAVGMVVHGQLVRLLTDQEIPLVLAKLMADVCVFTFGQLLLLRFFVFPARGSPPRSRMGASHRDLLNGADPEDGLRHGSEAPDGPFSLPRTPAARVG